MFKLGGSLEQVSRLSFFLNNHDHSLLNPTARTNIVPRTTYKMVVPLDNLQKQGWPVLHGLGEDLKEVALVVEINQDFQFLGRRTWFKKLEGGLGKTAGSCSPPPPPSPVKRPGPPSPWSWLFGDSAAGRRSRCQALKGTPSLGHAGSLSVSKIKSSALAFTCRPGKRRWERSVCNQEPHSFDDAGRVEGDVLHARSSVIVHVFLRERRHGGQKADE